MSAGLAAVGIVSKMQTAYNLGPINNLISLVSRGNMSLGLAAVGIVSTMQTAYNLGILIPIKRRYLGLVDHCKVIVCLDGVQMLDLDWIAFPAMRTGINLSSLANSVKICRRNCLRSGAVRLRQGLGKPTK